MKDKILALLKLYPGLKGREIAKRIDVPKKEVNTFLSRNLDVFRKNNDHKWFVNIPDECLIEFLSLWMDSPSFENVLLGVGSPLDMECRTGSLR